MEGCENNCLQEKRIVKKELSTWCKKLPVLIGLEEVARSVLGKRLSRKLLEPIDFLSKDLPEPIDWNSHESCSFCIEKRSKATTEKRHQKEESCRNSLTKNVNGGKSEAAQKIHRNPYASGYYPQHHVTMYDPDKPLDLSLSSKKSEAYDVNVSAKESPSELKVPHFDDKLNSKKKDVGSVKRPYTDDDVSNAVHEIRSGKLGTRRAAVLYGIPRSTLRNKMCRGDASDGVKLAPKSNGLHFALGDGSDRQNEQALDQKTLSHICHKHDLNAGIDRPFGLPPLFYNDKYIRECEKAFKEANPYAYDLKLPFLQELIWHYAQERMNRSSSPTDQNNITKSVSASEETEMVVDDHVPSDIEKSSDAVQSSGNLIGQGHMSTATNQINEMFTNVVTKTIYEKLYPGLNLQSSLGSANDDTLTQPVFPQPCDTFYLPQNGANSYPVTSTFPADYKPPAKKSKVLPPPARKPKVTDTATDEKLNNNTSPDDQKPAKKSRPKRGQYRKYNHELLLEAVKAVQRGEMSVHRAGSYYGVPHSTLEYKVKERHLLRQKKPREPRGKKSSDQSNNTQDGKQETSPTTQPPKKPANGSTTPTLEPAQFPVQKLESKDSNASVEALQNSLLLSSLSGLGALPGYPVPPTFPLGLGWPRVLGSNPALPDPALLSLYAGYQGHASASELLKKLQAKVHSDVHSDEKSQPLNNSFEESKTQSPTHSPVVEVKPSAPLVEVSDK